MNCEEIKDLLLTDYIDGEMDTLQNEKVEDHLLRCEKCRSFKEQMEKNINLPLKQSVELKPSPFVWESIKNAIKKEKHSFSPIIAFVVLVLGVLFVSNNTYFNQGKTSAVIPTNDIEFFASLEEEESSSLGTVIEKVFL